MKVADIGVPQQASIDRTHGFTNSLKWNLGPALELRAITRWRGVDASHWDNSGGAHRPPVFVPNSTVTIIGVATPGSLFSRYSLADLRQRQFSQELQAVGTVDSIDYVAGLFYFNEHVSDDAATPSSNLWNATDVLHLTVGGRYTHDRKRGILHVSRGVNDDTNPPAAGVGYQPLDKSWNRFNPMVTLAYDVTEQTHVYAKYATSYRAGGASSRTSNYQPFDPEDVKSYEVGLKTDLFDHRARLNLAGYIMDRKDSQVDISSIQFVGSSSFNNLVTINAPGITKIRGIEADLTVNPVERLTLNAAYAYTHTKIPPVLITARDAAGRSTSVYQDFYIVFTPRNAASGWIDYAVPVAGDATLKFHLDGNYAQATQAFDQFATKNDASLLFNGRISLADIPMGGGQALTVGVWARNLFDEQYVYRRDPSNSLPGAPTSNVTTGSIGNVLGDYGNFNAPRTFGIDASLKF
jgi:iron complex outermembrane receptor protein